MDALPGATYPTAYLTRQRESTRLLHRYAVGYVAPGSASMESNLPEGDFRGVCWTEGDFAPAIA